MAIDTTVSPYHDDYDESKLFSKILFRPERAVQVRELNQIQTILQNQVSRFGDHVFEDGSIVIPGEVKHDLNFKYVKVTLNGSYTTFESAINSAGSFAVGETSILRGDIQLSKNVEDSDPVTLFVKYIDGGDDSETTAFADAETINLYAESAVAGDLLEISGVVGKFAEGETVTGGTSTASGSVVAYTKDTLYVNTSSGTFLATETVTGGTSAATATVDTVSVVNLPAKITDATVIETGVGSGASVTSGIYYTRGNFAIVLPQAIVLDKYSAEPTYRIGFKITEEIVTFQEDPTLLDNATGAPNQTAPGADRLKTSLILETRGIDTTDDEDFIEIIRLEDGEVKSKVRGPNYSVLESVLARRTYDESGDYVVDPFDITVIEHLDDEAGNGGAYTAANGGDALKVASALDSGKAYVRGYEVQTDSSTYVAVDKARDVESLNNSVTNVKFGNYIRINNMNVLPEFSDLDKVDLYSGAVGSDGVVPGGSLVGTARVRHIEYASGTIDSQASATFNLYLFDVRNTSGDLDSTVMAGALSVWQAGATFTADITDSSEIFDVANNTLVFPLPISAVSTLKPVGGIDTTYSVSQVFNTTADASGDVLINAGSEEVFAQYSATDYLLTIIDDSTIEDLTGKVALSGSPTGKSLTIALGIGNANKSVRLVATVIKQLSAEKTKTKNSTSKSGSLTSGAMLLDKCDVFSITSVIDDTTSQDITDQFDFDSGRRESYYGVGKVKQESAFPAPSGTITVTFEYFAHGPGDYFSVDSYSGIAYEDIPSEVINGVDTPLSDVVDFRPRFDDTGADFTSAGSSYGSMVKSGEYFRSDFDYYLSRIDKLYVDYKGEFGIVRGIPAVNPVEPNDPADSIVLYVLNVPAYTRSPEDVVVSTIDNRRYTMRDIGKLETRIKNLEYYTTLNALEKNTTDLKILDGSGNDRFKNGFMVDGFTDHNVGFDSRQDYRCSVDPENGVLRPQFSVEGVNLDIDESASTNFQKTGTVITLPYTEQLLVKQPFATSTMNVNPYAVFSWTGNLKLTPSRDSWVDTRYTQPIELTETRRTSRTRTVNAWNWGTWNWGWNTRWGIWRWGWGGSRLTNSTTTTSSTTTKRVVGDREVSRSSIPYMRSRTVTFSSKGLKPWTRVYPYFDGVRVDAHVKRTGGSYGGSLVTDKNGNISGTFRIPNTSSMRFRVGAKMFKLMDRTDNDELLAQTTSEATYTAAGTLVQRQKTILSTQTVQTTTTNTFTRTRTRTRVRWSDPLAQTFLIENSGGVFITSLDVYVSTKDPNVPLTLQIRETDNGYPAQEVVPGGEVTLNPSQVSISTGSNNPTKFTFANPLYLQEGSEYCFVLMANSVKYNVWIARMGEQVVGTKSYVSKQPHVGVMFKSQNASTWTAAQNDDIKFTINRAKFDTTKQPVIKLTNVSTDDVTLFNSPIKVTNASSTASVYHQNHGLVVGSQVTMSGCVGGSGIADATLNKTHTVTNVADHDIFDVVLTETASSDGFIGGANAVCGVNHQFNVCTPNINEFTLNNTTSDWEVDTISGKSLDGSETAFVAQATPAKCINGDDVSFTNPMLCLNDTDETANNSGNRSITVTGTLTSSKDNLSPVVDLNGSTVMITHNRINKPGSLNETSADGGNAVMRYITHPSGLKLAANSIKVYLDVNRPQGADVELFYKTAFSEQDVLEADWVSLPVITKSPELDDGVFYENEYGVDAIGEYTHYMIKIVGTSDNSSKVPSCKNLRAIALGT